MNNGGRHLDLHPGSMSLADLCWLFWTTLMTFLLQMSQTWLLMYKSCVLNVVKLLQVFQFEETFE